MSELLLLRDMCICAMICRLETVKKRLESFVTEEDGIGTVEMILILIVLIALVIIFRDQLKTIVNDLFDKVTTQSNSV